eukprot:5009256-Lingulodinium_polyedra.AAC.1
MCLASTTGYGCKRCLPWPPEEGGPAPLSRGPSGVLRMDRDSGRIAGVWYLVYHLRAFSSSTRSAIASGTMSNKLRAEPASGGWFC